MEKIYETEEAFRSDYKNFISDPDLERLQVGLNEPNIFDILRVSSQEIRHSNFLAWLLNPKGSHGLGSYFLKRILRDLLSYPQVENLTEFDIENLNYSNVEIRREWRNIDLLIILPEVVICIENKIYSKDHNEQLSTYKRIVESNFTDREKVFVYLTPEGELPKADIPEYISFSYLSIVKILEGFLEVHTSTTNPVAISYIEDYVSTLKRILMSDDKLSLLARKVYTNHSDILNFLFQYKPDAFEIIRNQLGILIKESGWVECSENKTYKRFTTPELQAFLPTANTPNGWPGRESFLFEFIIDEKRLTFKSVVSPKTGEVADVISDIISQLPDSSEPKGKQWRVHFSTNRSIKLNKIIEMEDEAIREELSKEWSKYTEIVNKISNALVDNKDRILNANSIEE